MKILGLDSGAQIIILQGLSTYTALASAYLFARPVLRTQPVEAHREILSDIKSNDTEVTDLLSQATGVLNKRIQLKSVWNRVLHGRLSRRFFILTLCLGSWMSSAAFNARLCRNELPKQCQRGTARVSRTHRRRRISPPTYN